MAASKTRLQAFHSGARAARIGIMKNMLPEHIGKQNRIIRKLSKNCFQFIENMSDFKSQNGLARGQRAAMIEPEKALCQRVKINCMDALEPHEKPRRQAPSRAWPEQEKLLLRRTPALKIFV